MLSNSRSVRLLITIGIGLVLVAALACAGDEAEPTATPAAAVAPTTAPAAPAPTTAAVVAPTTAPAAPSVALAQTYPTGKVKYHFDVPVPSSFSEAPMLAELVKAGKLPPVADRLPDEPRVIPPLAVGKYGGTWRRAYVGVTDNANVGTTGLIRWDGDGFTWKPALAKQIEFSNGGKTLTITLRKGHKWSDGQPFTSEDLKWTWESILTNEEFSPVLRSNYRSPETGTAPEFKVIDDVTVSYTWDNPNYAIVDRGLAGGSYTTRLRQLFAPAHYLKQFHPDFAKKADLDKLMSEAGVDNWVKLMKLRANSYQSVDLPTLAAWMTTDTIAGAEWITERNPYYHLVDTAGNQLPYIDRIHLILMENVEAIALRAAAGDIDFQGRHMTMDKIPLWLENAEKSGIGVTQWTATSGSDAAIFMNLGYTKDMVIGDLLRNRDFRIALTLAVDREDIKETFFQGFGDPRAFVPEPGSLYYPGDEYRYLYAKRDLAKSNELLDKVGLSAKDSDGFRLRPGTTDRLKLHIVAGVEFGFYKVPEAILRHWRDVGIDGSLTQTRDATKLVRASEEYMTVWETGGGQNVWLYPSWHIPYYVGSRTVPLVGKYYVTKGEQGESPENAKYANPEGKFPFKRLLELYDEGKKYPLDSPERIAMGKEVNRIHAEEVFIIPTVGSTSFMKGTFVRTNRFKNVPENTANGTGLHGQGPYPETYYIEE